MWRHATVWRPRCCTRTWTRTVTGRGVTAAAPDSARPDLEDVERLTRGEAARKRGTGSREVPHRLNAEERSVWDLAKRRNYMALSGTGYRRERKGSPLMNSWRQYADASARAAVYVCNSTADNLDTVVLVDLSPLRCAEPSGYAAVRDACVAAASTGEEAVRIVRDDLPATEAEVLTAEQWSSQPIWNLPPLCIGFACWDRPQAKALAEQLALQLWGPPQAVVKTKPAAARRRLGSRGGDDDGDGSWA